MRTFRNRPISGIPSKWRSRDSAALRADSHKPKRSCGTPKASARSFREPQTKLFHLREVKGEFGDPVTHRRRGRVRVQARKMLEATHQRTAYTRCTAIAPAVMPASSNTPGEAASPQVRGNRSRIPGGDDAARMRDLPRDRRKRSPFSRVGRNSQARVLR